MGDSQHTYRGDHITVTWDKRKCIHAGTCVRGLPAVFDPKARPWITPDSATADEVASVVAQCPTGALTYARHDDGPAEAPHAQNEITLQVDGPAMVRGDVAIVDGTGAEVARTKRAALCRCGGSKNMPYCDNSHQDNGFRDPGQASEARLGGDAEGGCLTIKVAPNGPLILDGPVTLRDADGAECARGAKGALCRCGQSTKKPLCDGTHGRVGFEAP